MGSNPVRGTHKKGSIIKITSLYFFSAIFEKIPIRCQHLGNLGNDVSSTDPKYYVYDYDGTNVNEAKATNNYITYAVMNGTSIFLV